MSVTAIIARHGETVTVTRYASSKQSLNLVFSADFVSGNVISLNVNSHAVSVSFTSNQATTLAALATAIEACDGIDTATAGTRQIAIVSEWAGNAIVLTKIKILGGATQPVSSITGVTGGFVDGIYDAGTSSTFTAIMSVQPLNGRELMQIPEELQRTRQLLKGYTTTELFTVETSTSKKADRVTRANGTVYEVQKVEEWGGALAHFKVVMAELNEGLN